MFKSLFARSGISSLVRPFLPQPCKLAWQIRTMSAVKTSHLRNEDVQANQLFDVSHVVAVVTGGGTGIGLMIAQALQSNGAKVYITGRREEALDAVVKQYSTGPGSIHALPGDITKKDECIRLADEVAKQQSKGIHLLVNNAGIARDDNTKFSAAGQPDMKSADSVSQHMLKSDPLAWAETFETNVTAQFFMTAAFVSSMSTRSFATHSMHLTSRTMHIPLCSY
jgi:NAD(P)-dependent dehydrogenase (short-subunit alcohol dehydrogenase family)